jgi:hypothetical protein
VVTIGDVLFIDLFEQRMAYFIWCCFIDLFEQRIAYSIWCYQYDFCRNFIFHEKTPKIHAR